MGKSNLNVIICKEKANKNSLINFRRKVYKGDINFKNNEEFLLKQMLYGKTVFTKQSNIQGILVEDNGEIVASCLLIHAYDYKQYLQIGFFEAVRDDDEIIDTILVYCNNLCEEKKIASILIGMNGHVNFGIGILHSNFKKTQSFGGSYNKDYYTKMWDKVSTKKVKQVSFFKNTEEFNMKKYDKLIKRLDKRFKYRNIIRKKLRKEIEIYTQLNNKIFSDHDYYYKRETSLDYELFKDLFYLIKEENMIFAYDGDKPIGFLLWYPDYNKLIKKEKHFGIQTVIKNLFYSKKIDTFKIMEIGVLKEYRTTGVILGLFNELYKKINKKFKYCETSWILDKNFKSKNLGIKFEAEPYKEFIIFEINRGSV